MLIMVMLDALFFTDIAWADTRNEASSRSTVVFGFDHTNCPNDMAVLIETAFKDRLKRIPNLTLISLDELKTNKEINEIPVCYDGKCAVKFARSIGAKKAIVGSIKKEIHATKEQMGDNEYKYLYEIKPHDLYIVKIVLYDVPENAIDIESGIKAQRNELYMKLDSLADQMKNYFKPIMPAGPPGLTPWIAVYGSVMVPTGKFRNIIQAAGGVSMDVGLTHAIIPHTYCKVSGSYYFLSRKNGTIKGFQTAAVSAYVGAYFTLPKGFSIAPMFGVGCQFHRIGEVQYNIMHFNQIERKRFDDPMITIRCEGTYRFYNNLYVAFTPGYTMFFERGAMGHYVNIDVGLKYEFSIKDKR